MKNFNNKILWNSNDLSRVLNVNILGNWKCNKIEIDSRKVKPGCLFLALKGKNLDGHDFIKDAINNGAVGVVINKKKIFKTNDNLIISVDDVYKSMLLLAEDARNQVTEFKDSAIIAITGSSGKTSTKEMLYSSLSQVSDSYANPESYNNHVGVPYSLLNMPRKTRYGIFEIGMNHANEIRPLSKLVKPNIVIITNITEAHIGNFKSLYDIVKAKSEIFEGLARSGYVIINRDFKSYDKTIKLAKKNGVKNIISYGRHKKSDINLISISALSRGQRIEAKAFGKKYIYKINFEGSHQAINSLSILGTLLVLKQDMRACLKSMFSSFLPNGRGNKYIFSSNKSNLVLIDDTYNANPSSVIASIKMLNEIANKKRKVMILGEMRELGNYSNSLHLSLTKYLIEAKMGLLILVGNKTKGLYNKLKMKMECVWVKNSEDLIANNFIELILPGDFMIVKGSRSMSMETLVDYIKNIYSSKE